MQLIKELLSISVYRPTSGYSLDLVKMIEKGMDRSQALQHWVAMGRSEGSFYKAYKSLKDDLLRLAVLDRGDISGQKARRLEVWEKYRAIQQLLITEKKMAAVELAVELVRKAVRAGFTEIVVGLASLLETHFGSVEPDTRRYLRYRKLRRDYARFLEDELEVKALQARLVFYIKRKKDVGELEEDIRSLSGKKTGSPVFMRYRFSTLSIWYEMDGDMNGLMEAFRETVAYYERCEAELPPAFLSNLYFRLTPRLAAAGQYAAAEAHLSRGLKTTREGTQNWHLLMLQKACLGLVSGKSGITESCYKKAVLAPQEHYNAEIPDKWEVVKQLAAKGAEEFEEVWPPVFAL